jgi:hypothetical protein
MRALRTLALAVSCCLSLALPAGAYNEQVHAFLTRKALAGQEALLGQLLAAPTPQDHDALRARFWLLASQARDPVLRAEFLASFPSAEALTAARFKEWLMLDPAATVHGLQPTKDDRDETLGALLPLASRWPDDDERNRRRFLRDAKGEIVRGPDGQPLPYDPATLWMGSLTGTSSQGHAHYGLLPPPLSEDPEVLKKDPRHFAIPGHVQTFGAEFAQLYSDLSLVARGSGLPSARWLEAAFAGASLHHAQDVANQIHTVQVGIYDFFEAAFLQSKLRDLQTLGGLLGERSSLETLGLRLVSNHHLLLEDLFARRLAESEGSAKAARPLPPEVAQAVAGLDQDDAEFAAAGRAAMQAAREKGEGQMAALVRALIERSSFEGPELYRLIWSVSTPDVHDGRGHEYLDGRDQPDNFVAFDRPSASDALARFYTLQGKGLHRATTAQRLWREGFEQEAAAAGADQRAVERTLAWLSRYHAEAKARRAAYVPKPSGAGQGIAWGYPAAALVLLCLAALLVRRLARR